MKNGFWKVFIYEWKIWFSSPKRIFLTMGFPMILFFFFGYLFNSGSPKNYGVALVDYDQTVLSRKLIRGLNSTPEIKFTKIVNDEKDAKQLLQRGEVYSLIIIPKNTQKNILKGQSSEIICYTNGQYLMPAGNISKAFKMTIRTFSAGINLEKRMKKGQEYASAYGDIQPIKLDIHTLYNPYSNYEYYLATPFFPFMLQILVMIMSIYIIATPIKYGYTQSWFEMSNKNAWYALWGKLLPYTIIFIFIGWFMNFYLFKIIGTPLQTSMFSVVMMTSLLILVNQLLAVIFVGITKDMRSALTFGAGFCAICFSFGAYTFPIEGLPKFVQNLGQIFPYTHFIKYYINRAIKGIPLSYTIHYLYTFIVYLLLFFITYPLFVKKLKTDNYV